MNAGRFPIPRTLIVSNNCFSGSNANGRTMLNFFRDAEPGSLAQFYISGTPEPGFPCEYFRVSDTDALRSLLPFGALRRRKTGTGSASKKEQAPARNCRNLVLRNLVWQTGRWKNQAYRRFLREFSPELVLLQAGDAPFMYRIARQISDRFRIPLVIYNSEGYVLKDVLYASASALDPWHRHLRRVLKKEFDRTMRRAAYCIYNTEYLEDCYLERYPDGPESCALYTVSKLEPLPPSEPEPFTLLYCGNLRVGRDEVLGDIARVLDDIKPPVRLDIYGAFPSPESEAALSAHPSVRCHGVIPYDQIPQKMTACTMLLHCEKEDRVKNLAHAFSTKIADSLASGKPFLVCASDRYPFVQYLRRHNCAHLVPELSGLEACLTACRDAAYLNRYREAALRLAAENHSYEKNAARMARILRDVQEKKN